METRPINTLPNQEEISFDSDDYQGNFTYHLDINYDPRQRPLDLKAHFDAEKSLLNLDRTKKKYLPKFTAEDIQNIVVPFLKAHAVKILNLNDHRISDKGAMLLASVESLEVLYLKGNEIGDDGAIFFAQSNLNELDLADNWIDSPGIHALSQANIQSLVIDNNNVKRLCYNELIENPNLIKLSATNCDNFWESFGVSVGKNSTLKSLIINDIFCSRFGYFGIEALLTNKSLTELSLSNNNTNLCPYNLLSQVDLSSSFIGDAEAALFYGHPSLTNLNLSKNNIGNAGARCIAYIPNLEILDLSWNRVGNTGALQLSYCMKLRDLNLQRNLIRNKGAKYLSYSESLRNLDLSGNRILTRGARWLKQSYQIDVINLKCNKIDFNCTRLITANNPRQRVREISKKSKIPELTLFSLFAVYNKMKTKSPEAREKIREEIMHISPQLDIDLFNPAKPKIIF